MSKIKKSTKLLITITVVAILLGIGLYHAFSRIVPSQAVSREAVTTKGGDTINIDGFDLWYTLYNAESEETPIIVVAGGCALSSDYLEDSLLFLADTHPVLFYDNRGCGRSQIKPDLSNYSIQIFTNEIEKLREHFFAGRDVAIVAHSFGGIIAMKYAAEHPDKLQKLILISSIGAKISPAFSSTYYKTGLPPRNQTAANDWYMQNIDIFLGAYFQNESAKSIFKNTLASYAVMMQVGKTKIDMTHKISNINIPVLLLIGGEKEYPTTGIDVAQELEKLLSNVRLEQFTNCGHFLFAEDNVRFQLSVNQFLNEGSG